MRNVPEVGILSESDGSTLVVPSQRIARLIGLGIAAERKERKKATKRKAEKQARRRNRR